MTPATEPLLSQLRSRYLDSLCEPQELYCETANRKAAAYLSWVSNEVIGYLLTDGSGTLLEFHVVDERRAEAAFDQAVRAHSIRRALCKSFDHLLLSLCLERAVVAKPTGVLFRTIVDEIFLPRETIGMRLAELRDLQRIKAINDGFFENDDEIGLFIERRSLILYDQEDELVGCGLVQPVIAGRAGHDIGMLVSPSRRRVGFGEYIVRHLKVHCLSQGFRPICGCDIENSASRACLEAAGFRSRHRLVELQW